MPRTMPRVEAILRHLHGAGVPPVTLLVVPGLDWSPAQLERLRELAALGHPMAAHGWCHHTEPRRLRHRLHAALISRNVAEHLALDTAGVLELMQRSQDWFPAQDLPRPTLYVPPAWALGAVGPADLAQTPYAQVEVTSGVWQREANGPFRLVRLPLTGYEADTPLRQWFLTRWNGWQVRRACQRGLPLRLSIHPDDLHLRVAGQLREHLAMPWQCLPYGSLLRSGD